ncbi:Outer membrane protein beta-barrel domain-containing protein [Flavobacterium fluvii]|uniref:Outer membrane protein beta-barrel domain-containing protein n=2 Tax=Flavobacterium fluvii TaxID=468056 RepID=A0A1M5JS85_9FLAO|nr:Outer membrane protein beta-barrel domain-containing protein [Flavobacterium fluvii]
MMKKYILSAIAIFTIGFVSAQNAKFGVKGGGVFASSKIMIGDSDTGFYVGGFSDVAVSEKFHVQPEVLYVYIKELSQIQVPILAKVPVVENFSLLAGPNFGFILNTDSYVKSFNFGLDFGASVDVSEDFSLDLKYNLGLTDLNKAGNSDSSFKINALLFGLGYKF